MERIEKTNHSELIADEGKYITLANIENEDERMFWTAISISKATETSVYRDATSEEKADWEETHKPEFEPYEE